MLHNARTNYLQVIIRRIRVGMCVIASGRSPWPSHPAIRLHSEYFEMCWVWFLCWKIMFFPKPRVSFQCPECFDWFGIVSVLSGEIYSCVLQPDDRKMMQWIPFPEQIISWTEAKLSQIRKKIGGGGGGWKCSVADLRRGSWSNNCQSVGFNDWNSAPSRGFKLQLLGWGDLRN